MSDVDTTTWSETAASNNAATPNGFPEGQAPSTVNDCAREVMGALKREWNRTHPTISSAGTSTAITLTYTTAPAAYVAGLKFQFKVGTTNGATPTLNVNALGTKNIYKIVAGVATQIAASDWTANQIVEVTYDTTLNASAGGFIWTAANPGDAAMGMPRSYLAGLTLANNGTDNLDIAVGAARDGGNTADMILASALTKQTNNAWAVGTAAGSLDTGAVGNNTYAVWLIKRPDTGVVDVLTSLSFSAPTMPTNFTLKRYIGAIIRSGGSVVSFVQRGDRFMRAVPVRDISAANPGTAAVTRTLSVPVGLAVTALVTVGGANGSNNWFGLLSALTMTDSTPSVSLHNCALGGATYSAASPPAAQAIQVDTNTSAQIRSRISASGASDTLDILTHGWIDTRGRDT